jgi:hypothetical protein
MTKQIGREQLFLVSPGLQLRAGKKYCDETELLPLLRDGLFNSCNCKKSACLKSACLKSHCERFQSNVSCHTKCRCAACNVQQTSALESNLDREERRCTKDPVASSHPPLSLSIILNETLSGDTDDVESKRKRKRKRARTCPAQPDNIRAEATRRLSFLLACGSVKRVQTIDVDVCELGGSRFTITLDAASPTVGEAKTEIARIQGTKEHRQELYKVAQSTNGAVVREDDVDPEVMDDEEETLEHNTALTLATKEESERDVFYILAVMFEGMGLPAFDEHKNLIGIYSRPSPGDGYEEYKVRCESKFCCYILAIGCFVIIAVHRPCASSHLLPTRLRILPLSLPPPLSPPPSPSLPLSISPISLWHTRTHTTTLTHMSLSTCSLCVLDQFNLLAHFATLEHRALDTANRLLEHNIDKKSKVLFCLKQPRFDPRYGKDAITRMTLAAVAQYIASQLIFLLEDRMRYILGQLEYLPPGFNFNSFDSDSIPLINQDPVERETSDWWIHFRNDQVLGA